MYLQIVSMVGGAVILVVIAVLMWRYVLRGLFMSMGIVTLCMLPFVGPPTTTEQLPPLQLFAEKFAGSVFTAVLLCLMLYGLVIPFRCWFGKPNTRPQQDGSPQKFER